MHSICYAAFHSCGWLEGWVPQPSAPTSEPLDAQPAAELRAIRSTDAARQADRDLVTAVAGFVVSNGLGHVQQRHVLLEEGAPLLPHMHACMQVNRTWGSRHACMRACRSIALAAPPGHLPDLQLMALFGVGAVVRERAQCMPAAIELLLHCCAVCLIIMDQGGRPKFPSWLA